jgi:chromosomal replication initiation ATPase DnaA
LRFAFDTTLLREDDGVFELGCGSVEAVAPDATLASREIRLEICEGMLDVASALFNVSGRELRQPGRTSKSIARVRQIAMYVTHCTLGLTMTDIGTGFGRDRTTVLHACHLIEDMRDDIEFDRIVTTFERIALAAFGGRYGVSR